MGKTDQIQTGKTHRSVRQNYVLCSDRWLACQHSSKERVLLDYQQHVKSFPGVACVLPWLLLQEGLGIKEPKSMRFFVYIYVFAMKMYNIKSE